MIPVIYVQVIKQSYTEDRHKEKRVLICKGFATAFAISDIPSTTIQEIPIQLF